MATARASLASTASLSRSPSNMATARATPALLVAPPEVNERFTVAGGYS
jgi:hypothetical protein